MGKAHSRLWITRTELFGTVSIDDMGGLPDPDWYLDNVLIHAEPGGAIRPGPAAQWQAWWRGEVRGAPPRAIAAQQGFVLTVGELERLGFSRSAIRTEIRRGRWSVPARGAVAPLRIETGDDSYLARRRRHALRATATQRRRCEHVIAGRSAAIVHGLPTMHVPQHVELLAPDRAGLDRRRSGHSFGAALPIDEITDWFGVPVTTVARTLVELARHDRRDAIMALDAALRERLVTPGALDASLRGAVGWPGVRQARAVLALGDPRAESPLESITRLALHDDGFPPPELQFEIAGYRVDFCWPAQRLILEADGRGKYTGDALWDEKTRELPLRRERWRVERVVWGDVARTWPTTSAALRELFTAD